KVEGTCAGAQSFGLGEVFVLELVGLMLHKTVGILGEAPGTGQKKTGMARTLGKQAFNQLEAERRGVAYQVGIVVAGIDAAAAGERVAEFVDGVSTDAARVQEQDHTHSEHGPFLHSIPPSLR